MGEHFGINFLNVAALAILHPNVEAFCGGAGLFIAFAVELIAEAQLLAGAEGAYSFQKNISGEGDGGTVVKLKVYHGGVYAKCLTGGIAEAHFLKKVHTTHLIPNGVNGMVDYLHTVAIGITNINFSFNSHSYLS